MPELPEVETVANGVNDRIRGQVIDSVWFGSKPEPFRTPAAEMANHLPGHRIDRVRRVGKHIVFDLGPPPPSGGKRKRPPTKPSRSERPEPTPIQWLVHLGMTGRLLVSSAETPVPLHTHAVLHLSSGAELRFVDARRFGRLTLLLPSTLPIPKGPRQNPDQGFQGPGTEPLTVSAEDFVTLFKSRKLSIKSALLNQRLLHGVGNIYADESLFRAGIRPRRMAGRLKQAELLRLRQALIQVLKDAIARGGSSVSDYVDADGVKGFFQLEHGVYQRTGKPCLACGTPIRRLVLGGRSTHYCPKCQR